MKEFTYTALGLDGAVVTGSRFAAGRAELARELEGQKLVLLKSRPVLGLRNLAPSLAGRVGPRELIELTQHLATSLGAGILLITALEDFESQSKGLLHDVVADVRSNVAGGTAFDEALGRHPAIFDPVYLALTEVGRRAGDMDAVFKDLVAYLEWREELQGQMKQAMVYPSLLFTAIVGLFLLMMFFVVPRFSDTFAGAGFELPALTRGMMSLGAFMIRWWWLVFGGIAAVVIGARAVVRTESGRRRRDALMLRLPVVGTFVRKVALARFARTFSLIFASGLDLIQLLKLVEGVVDNAVLAAELRMVRMRVITGESLRAAFADTKEFPPLVQRLVAVGEATGSLDQSLLHAAQTYDKEIPRDLKKALAVFDALIIAVLGLLVCVAALSLLMPIMQVGGNIR
ncbi:MAG TPA: type II secretion system F family protein [Candidatus Krumholzibacteria bacterium]|nr:type II secretion system F family protein [Candidatus Krumholzibacteria bacterium]